MKKVSLQSHRGTNLHLQVPLNETPSKILFILHDGTRRVYSKELEGVDLDVAIIAGSLYIDIPAEQTNRWSRLAYDYVLDAKFMNGKTERLMYGRLWSRGFGV